MRTLTRVDADGFDRLGRPTNETDFFLSSLPMDGLSAGQWMRRHWAVETTLQILDDTFEEDERPLDLSNLRLTVIVMILRLRRIGYSLLAVFTLVTQRTDQRHIEPWHVVLQRLCDALLLATDEKTSTKRSTPD